MAKFEFTKTLEATKLNKRTGSPTNEERTISFGAVIDNLEDDGDYVKFVFLGEPYRIKQDILRSAIRPVGGGGGEQASAPTRTSRSAAAEPPEISLVWEDLKSDVRTRRAKLPGGWLVAVTGFGLTFYPDPEHQWDGKSLP